MLRAGRFDFEFRQEQKINSFPKRPGWPWGPASLLFSEYRGYFLGVKRPGREVKHSPPSNSEARNGESWTSLQLGYFGMKKSTAIWVGFYVLNAILSFVRPSSPLWPHEFGLSHGGPDWTLSDVSALSSNTFHFNHLCTGVKINRTLWIVNRRSVRNSSSWSKL
jgi:hypothetical protein